MCHNDRHKFKSPFGEPPVFEKKKQFDATTPRKRKPVSFFDPTRDRTIHQDSEGEQLSPRTDEKPLHDDDEDDRPQEVTENINIETSENINLGTFANESNTQELILANQDRSPASEDYPRQETREPKLFVDVNVANFGLKRIIVYEGDTVDSLVADFVKLCPIDESMIERLKELLKKQMDGVLERIDEDDDQQDDEDEGTFSLKDGDMMEPNNAEW